MSFLCSFILNSVKLLVTRYGSIVSVQNRLISHLCIRLFSHRWFVACFCFRKCSCSSSSVGFVSFIKLNRQIRISVTSFFVAQSFWDKKKQSILRTIVHPKHDEKIWYVQCSCLSFVRFCSFFLSVYFFSSQIFLNLRHHRFALFANDTAHILFSHITHGHCLFKWIEISTTLNNLQKFLMDDLISIEMAVKTKRSFLRRSCPRDEK